MAQLYFHEAAVSTLSALASLDERLGPTELICLWFDDVYFLGQRPPAGISPQVWGKGEEEWKSCFAADELRAMAEFHSYFDSVAEELPCDSPNWKGDPHWQQVSARAKQVLDLLSK